MEHFNTSVFERSVITVAVTTVTVGHGILIKTALANLKGEAASSRCPFALVECFLAAKVSIGERRRCGDIVSRSGGYVTAAKLSP